MGINIFASNDLQNQAIAEYIEEKATELLKIKNRITIAVSGGKSPITLFKNLSNRNLDWDKITIVLVDERVVATTSPDSNENLVRTYLLKNKSISAKFIGLMDGNSIDLLKNANSKIKQIDLAILGMGEDGHTASIFPDCPELKSALAKDNPDTYIMTNSLSAKYQRISLTLAALINIPHLILSISGQTKLNVIKESSLKPNLNYPISYLIAQRPNMQIYWYE